MRFKAAILAGCLLAASGMAVGQVPPAAPTSPAPPAGFSTDTTIGLLLTDPAARAVLQRHIPSLVADPAFPFAGSKTLKAAQRVLPTVLTPQIMAAIAADLAAVTPTVAVAKPPSIASLPGKSTLRPPRPADTIAPDLPANLGNRAILVFTRPALFHNDAMEDSIPVWQREAKARGFKVFVTENNAVFNTQQLSHFKAVVWNNINGDILSADQREAFKAFVERGGGSIGLHGTNGTPTTSWPWFRDELMGATFTNHNYWPIARPEARITIDDRAHPVAAGMPAEFRHADEWYSFKESVSGKPGFRVIARVDETTYPPVSVTFDDIGMGKDHPIVWTHCVGKGRSFYSALGHSREAIADPLYQRMLGNAIGWATLSRPCRNGK